MWQPKQRGISLLELMLSLALIAILLVMATRYYAVTRQSQRIEEALEMLTAVYTAANGWLESENNFNHADMIKAFVDDGSLPAHFTDPNINPWGGALKAQPPTTPSTSLLVTLTQVPPAACQNLVAKVTQKIPAASQAQCLLPASFTVTFTLGQ